MNTEILTLAQQLSVPEQLDLVETLLDSIAGSRETPGPPPARAAELDWRVTDHEANPKDVVSWSEVKASARARIRQ